MDASKQQALNRTRGKAGRVVGVTVSLDPGRRWRRGCDYWYLNRQYTRAIAAAGLVPISLCPDTDTSAAVSLCDGLVLSGGGDLPSRLGELGALDAEQCDPSPTAETPTRVTWERQLIARFAEQQLPVLGICFGMQLMNLHFGGSLHTSLRQRPPNRCQVDHGRDNAPTSHRVEVVSNSRFLRNWQPPAKVSSAHRQGVDEVAPGFHIMARSADGLVEAIEKGPMVGIEWHPEADASGQAIYRRFAQYVRGETP